MVGAFRGQTELSLWKNRRPLRFERQFSLAPISNNILAARLPAFVGPTAAATLW
jgi:hypothetical protein